MKKLIFSLLIASICWQPLFAQDDSDEDSTTIVGYGEAYQDSSEEESVDALLGVVLGGQLDADHSAIFQEQVDGLVPPQQEQAAAATLHLGKREEARQSNLR